MKKVEDEAVRKRPESVHSERIEMLTSEKEAVSASIQQIEQEMERLKISISDLKKEKDSTEKSIKTLESERLVEVPKIKYALYFTIIVYKHFKGNNFFVRQNNGTEMGL